MGGAGRKSVRGTVAVASNENPKAPVPTQRLVAARFKSRSARSNRLPGWTRRATRASVIDHGGLATTRNGRRGRRRSRRVGSDDPELTVGHGVREPLAQRHDAARVELHGDDPRPGRQQGSGEGAVAGADVEHQVARTDAARRDQTISRARVEAVPVPARGRARARSPGHGGGSCASARRSSSAWAQDGGDRMGEASTFRVGRRTSGERPRVPPSTLRPAGGRRSLVCDRRPRVRAPRSVRSCASHKGSNTTWPDPSEPAI